MERELGVSLRDVEAAEAETVRRLAAAPGRDRAAARVESFPTRGICNRDIARYEQAAYTSFFTPPAFTWDLLEQCFQVARNLRVFPRKTAPGDLSRGPT